MKLEFMPEPLKDAPLQAVGKIKVRDNYDSDKPILLGEGNLPQGLVTLEGGEKFQVFILSDKIILELYDNKKSL